MITEAFARFVIETRATAPARSARATGREELIR